jgi:hypothetical protein
MKTDASVQDLLFEVDQVPAASPWPQSNPSFYKHRASPIKFPLRLPDPRPNELPLETPPHIAPLLRVDNVTPEASGAILTCLLVGEHVIFSIP